MPFNQFGHSATLTDVLRERLADISTVNQIETGKLQGRIRNSGANARATPSSNSDVVQGDFEGDTLNDGTYIYTLVNVTGVGLRWHRATLSIAW